VENFVENSHALQFFLGIPARDAVCTNMVRFPRPGRTTHYIRGCALDAQHFLASIKPRAIANRLC
jgi:hypothetical protein